MRDARSKASAPPPAGHAWVSVDSRRVLPAAQAEQVARFLDVVRQLDSLALRLPAVLHLMRDDQAGQPRAAATSREGDGDEDPLRRYWCFEHERSLSLCDADGLLCTGELSVGPSDPVGSAAVSRDLAARDERMLLRRLEQLVSVGLDVLGLAAGYPVAPGELEDPEPDDEVGVVWCRSCWKDEKRCEPITLRRSTGKPYYAGLCQWCGRTRQAIGGNRLPASDPRGDPPSWMVAKHHRGERVTPGEHAKAAKSIEHIDAGKKAKKGKKRK